MKNNLTFQLTKFEKSLAFQVIYKLRGIEHQEPKQRGDVWTL